MSQLIALVATAVMVDGVRTVIEAGQPLPGLSDAAAAELVRAGAAADADVKAGADAPAAESDAPQAKAPPKAKSKA